MSMEALEVVQGSRRDYLKTSFLCRDETSEKKHQRIKKRSMNAILNSMNMNYDKAILWGELIPAYNDGHWA